jgi:phosphopantetheinyl transferase
MHLEWPRIEDNQTGHEAAWRLLEEMYRKQTGEALPEVARTPLGKPYFPSGNMHLSLTHTGNLFAAVFSLFPIGIDAEKKDEEKRGVAQRFFSEKERKMPFSHVWTAKEAVAKIDGRGLGVIGKVRVEEDFAFLEDKKYYLERKQVGEYILTIAEMNQ